MQAIEQSAAEARQRAFDAAAQAHAVALNFTIGNFPELAGLTQEQIPAALHVLEHSNPQRFQQVVSQLAKLDQVAQANQKVQAHQRQQQAAQVRQWALAQDKIMDEYLSKNEDAATVRAVKDGLPKVLQAYGIDPQEFGQVVSQVHLFRSAPVQRMLYDLAKSHVLRDQVENKKHVPVPNVMRPGVSQPKSSFADGEIAAARERFMKDPNDVRAAAAYLQAKRNAR